jgi:predicted nucleic acid-binding protein
LASVLVDSNIILDVFTKDPVWEGWSSKALEGAADAGRLVINAIVFAEISVHFERIEEVDEALSSLYERETIPFEAAFLAGKAFSTYRQRGGSRTSPLSDFFIGAHAAVKGYDLLARDVGHYRSYFPNLRLIAPD